ncbi:MBL fold metallo-hydrolase [candidate division KSB1 bacterium]|nr:MBL fold metallo-hydrolase [candidate division KSB1 bacterium]
MKVISSISTLLLVLFSGVNPGFSLSANEITMTIVYDNYVFQEGTRADWGFSCFIEGTEKTILFDTGYDGQILLQNIDTLGVELDSLELVFISHDHLDHTGGLDAVMGRNSNISVYFGASFPESFSQDISDNGGIPIRVSDPIQICENVYSTGEIQSHINEQSLILDTDEGLIIITGCSHPGILNIVRSVKSFLDKEIYLVFGGFHLEDSSEVTINWIIRQFKAMGVKKCGPSHCTGSTAIAMFREAYGEDFVVMGVGKTIQVTASHVSPVDDSDSPAASPRDYMLRQNYPNPFNAGTTIQYSIPCLSHVNLTLFDISGKELITLVDAFQPAGTHSIHWNGQDAAGHQASSGIYLCQMQTGTSTEAIRIALVK